MLEIGSLVDGKYKILTKVGQGGMSVVYLAINEKANKQWAVKEVRKDGIKDFEVVKQGLVAETDILKKLNHDNLPSIIDVIDTDDSFIIIMDYIQGNSLNKALEEYGAQPQENVIAWAKQLCDVLGYLHTRTPAIIYRDMKPANVMLKPDGNVTLIDFGTAREFKEKNLADTTCLGTVGYAAPEQFGGMGQTDARTDIYCLGATLYHLVTGMNPCEPPYEIKPIREINPALSSGLERIILKCTQRDPNDRYQSAAELMYALEHYEEIDDIYRKKQKRKLGAFIATATLTLVCAGISFWGYSSAEEKKSENYEYLVDEAQKAAESGMAFNDVIDKYHEAILTDPTRTEAFLGTEKNDMGLIKYLLEGDEKELTVEEERELDQFKTGIEHKGENVKTVDVMAQLKVQNPEGYEQVCYQIGEAYLFYYKSGREVNQYKKVEYWFKDLGENYPMAPIYCVISDCLEEMDNYKTTEQMGKWVETAEQLWIAMKDLDAKAQTQGEDMQIKVWRAIVNIISNHAVELYDVIPQDELKEYLESIKTKSANINKAILQESIDNLVEKIDEAVTRIDSVQKSNK